MKYSALCLLLFSPCGLALFFILGEKDHHCFHEEYESDVMLRFEFNATLRQKSTPVGLVFHIYDVESKTKLFAKEYASDSTVSYRTGAAGSYGMCISTDSTRWAMYAKDHVMVHFRFSAEYMRDDDATDNDVSTRVISKVKASTKAVTPSNGTGYYPIADWQGPDASLLHSLERRVDVLKKDMRWLEEMTRSSKFVEERFREMAEETNSRVLIWAAVQLALLLVSGWWQMRSLRSFFISKKLV